MLAWRIPWAFACAGCQVLLADTCPDCGRRHRGRERAAAVPSLMWPGWALRLLPPWGRDFQRSRVLLAVILVVAVTGEEYRTATRLLSLEPSRLGKLGNFTALLRQHGALEPVTAAICQLARNLDRHDAPVIDYARRRRQSRLCHAPLDAGSWRSQRDLLLAQHGRPAPPSAPAHEQLTRLLTIRGQPDLQHAARQLGTTTAPLARQVRQLEDAAGTALLRTGPDGRRTLTAHARLLARDDRPALETITQPRERNPGHAP